MGEIDGGGLGGPLTHKEHLRGVSLPVTSILSGGEKGREEEGGGRGGEGRGREGGEGERGYDGFVGEAGVWRLRLKYAIHCA